MTDNQVTAEELTRMVAERRLDEYDAALKAGRLDRLLGVPEPQIALLGRAREGRIDVADVKALAGLKRHDLIEAARASDRIDYPTQEN